jgi:hypothetical protein
MTSIKKWDFNTSGIQTVCRGTLECQRFLNMPEMFTIHKIFLKFSNLVCWEIFKIVVIVPRHKV